MTNLAALLLASLLALSPSTADAYCASVTGLAPGIASPSGHDLPPDGGIVVGAFGEDVPLPTGDPAVQINWRIKTGDQRVTPKLVTLAPGLVVYSSNVRSGRIDLEDDNGKSKAWVIATNKKLPRLAPPVVKSVELIPHPAFTHIDLKLDTKPPAGAIAIVLTDTKGSPRSWGLVLEDAMTQQAYSSNRCEVVPNGSTLSQVGEKVRFFWVDVSGRPSKLSNIVTLTGTPKIPGVP